MFNLVEEFPSPRPSHVLKLGGIATLLVVLALAGFILLNPLPRLPDGEVLDVKLYVPRQSISGPNRSTLPVAASDSTQPLLVLTPVKIHNSGDSPLSIFDLSAVVRLGEAEYDSADVSAEDFQRVFRFYPDLASYQEQPLLRHSVIQPGQTLEGMLIFNYSLTEEQWDQRTSFQVKASFDGAEDIVLAGTDMPDNRPKLNAQAW
jgi:hypothetical protein